MKKCFSLVSRIVVLTLLSATAGAQHYDVFIKNGLVIDGSGTPERYSDGMAYVLVSGKFALINGNMTGYMNGKFVSHKK